MPRRRTFSPTIVCSDKFLDKPVSARELYFQFGMNADDDGFVGNPRKIMRMIGASDDDFRILIASNLVMLFESGVIVITDWRINNLLRSDWHHNTIYTKEKSALKADISGRYELGNESVTLFDLNRLDMNRFDIGAGTPQENKKEDTQEFQVGNLGTFKIKPPKKGIHSQVQDIADQLHEIYPDEDFGMFGRLVKKNGVDWGNRQLGLIKEYRQTKNQTRPIQFFMNDAKKK